MGREPRLDDIRKAAAQFLRLRDSATINVIDPTKSFQPQMKNADVVCRISHRSIDARTRGEVKVVYRIDAYFRRENYTEYEVAPYQDVHDAEPVIVVGSGPAGMFAALKLLTPVSNRLSLKEGRTCMQERPTWRSFPGPEKWIRIPTIAMVKAVPVHSLTESSSRGLQRGVTSVRFSTSS